MTSRSILLLCLLASGCHSKSNEAQAAASASAAPSALASVDPWAGCTVLGAGESIVAQCAWPRSLTRTPLPAMSKDAFEQASGRFFSKVAKAGGAPTPDELTLPDGQKVTSAKMNGKRTSKSGNATPVVLRTAGLERKDKSGLFLTCVALDDATCVADIERMIASPPPPSKVLK